MSIYENIKKQMFPKKVIPFLRSKTNLIFHVSSICKWDVNTPGIDKVKKFADILGCKVDDLLKE